MRNNFIFANILINIWIIRGLILKMRTIKEISVQKKKNIKKTFLKMQKFLVMQKFIVMQLLIKIIKLLEKL